MTGFFTGILPEVVTSTITSATFLPSIQVLVNNLMYLFIKVAPMFFGFWLMIYLLDKIWDYFKNAPSRISKRTRPFLFIERALDNVYGVSEMKQYIQAQTKSEKEKNDLIKQTIKLQSYLTKNSLDQLKAVNEIELGTMSSLADLKDEIVKGYTAKVVTQSLIDITKLRSDITINNRTPIEKANIANYLNKANRNLDLKNPKSSRVALPSVSKGGGNLASDYGSKKLEKLLPDEYKTMVTRNKKERKFTDF